MLNHQFQSLSNQVQKHSHWHPCSYRWWLAIFVFASSNWLTALSLSAATPPPGTVVDNQATGSFIEPINNTEIQIESNIVQVEIAEVAGITITGIATEEAPSNVNGAGTNQNDGNINPNDVVYFIYRIANVGNDPTQFFIPGAPSSITGGSLQGQIEIIAYDPDGSGDTAATDLSNPVPVPTEGISTGDPNALDLPNGSIPAEGTVTIRVPVKLDSTLSEGDTVSVVMGDTGSNDNSTETQNQVFIAGDLDVYTQDNPDGTTGEADGNPINGDATNQRREASYSQEVTVTLTTAPLDYGDAPDSYTTAQIRINSDVYLGSTAPDADTGSWHDGTDDSENATDDDTNDTPSAITAGDDEEDSVAFGPLDITMAGNSFNQDVRVTNNDAQPAYVRAWIDFDRDGTFDPNEVSNEVTVAGNAGDTTANLSFSIPSDISSGPSFARVIVSDTPNIAIAGQGTGEIEDHIINIGDEDICNFVPNTTFSAFDFTNASGDIGENLNLTSAVATYRNAVVDLDGIPLDVRATVNATEGKINKFGNGSIDGRDASEWYLAIGNNNANTGSSAEVRLEFFIAGTNIPRAISGQFATGDIDDKPAPNGRLEALLLNTTDFSGYALDGSTTIENPYPEGNYTVFEGTGDRSDQPDSFVTYTFNNQNSVNLILRTTDVEGTPSAGFPINGRIASTKINNAECSSVVIPTDYSDAPTDSTSYGVAAHTIASGIQLGSAIDADSGSLASADADGDDNNGTDDEDAFNTLPNVPTVGNYSLDVSVETTGNATLHGWIDFNKDGQFEASEYSSASVTSSGDIPLSWSVPAVTTPGDSYARFRLTSDTLTDDGTSDIDQRSFGSASDGEVEDYPVTIELAGIYDYGDAPDGNSGTGTGNYQTTSSDGGAAQVVINDPTSRKVLSLGENVDPDSGDLENADALADDEDGTPDDEDGVASFPTLTTAEGQEYTVSVTAKNNITEEVAGTQVGVPAYLVGFIDFNKDGDFTDPGERSETVTISSGNSDLRTFDVTFNTPAGMTPGDTYARFRLGQVEATAQSATGASAGTDNGEVEDYKIAIAPSNNTPPVISCPANFDLVSFNWSPDNDSQNGLVWSDSTTNSYNISGNLMTATLNRQGSTSSLANGSTFSGAFPPPGSGLTWLMNTPDNTNTQNASFTITFASPVPVSQFVIADIDASNSNSPTTWHDQVKVSASNSGNPLPVLLTPDDSSIITVTASGDTAFTADGVGQTRNDLPDANLTTTINGFVDTITIEYQDGPRSQSDPAQHGIGVGSFSACYPRLDLGDAPDTDPGTGEDNYQTLTTDDGASHQIVSGIQLGATVDSDDGSLQNSDATADDADDTDNDDDGVTLAGNNLQSQSLTEGDSITLDIATQGSGVLNAWIDWNNDGDFLDDDEQIATNAAEGGAGDSDNNVAGIQLNVNVPSNATEGNTFARFRYSTDTDLIPTGTANDGEVEDYQVEIASSPLITGNVCYSVADSGDTLTRIDRLTGAEVSIGDTGTDEIEAIAYSPLNNILYAVDGGTFGKIDTTSNTSTSGNFTAIGSGVGSGNGSAGAKNFNDIDGLTVDPYTGQVYGSVRDGDGGAPQDLLIEINPNTGTFIPNAFGDGIDYVVIQSAATTGFNDIDDITIDPDDGQLYGIANQGSNSNDRYVRINRTDGTTTLIGSFGVRDVEGLTAFNDGNIYMTTGNRGTSATNDTFYRVDPSGTASPVARLNVGFDYESVACLTGPPNSISGTVFLDSNNNATNDSESGTENVTVELYRDVNADNTVDDGDILLTTQQTNSDGDYNFLFAATGAYVLAIDLTTLPEGNTLTTDNVETANLNGLALSDTDNDFGHRAAPTSAPPPADSCPSSPIGLVDVGVSTFTGSGSGVGRQVRYPNVATVDGKALDMIGEVIALQNMDNLEEFGINGRGLANVTLTQTNSNLPINTRKFATVKYTFVETGTTNEVPLSFEFEVSDIDNNLRPTGSSRREYIIFPTSEFQDYFFADTTQMQAQLNDDPSKGPNGIEFSNSVPFDGNPSANPGNTVKFLINNRSSFTMTFGVEKNRSDRPTGRTGFGLDGAILPQLGKCDRYDYGDAPDSDSDTAANNYQTLLANGGPAHKIIDGLFLGPQKPDADNNGTPTINADGDDLSNTAVTFDDEDGVQLAGSELQGQTLEAGDSITLDIATQGSGVLNAWMDWNNDGDFLDADEKIATNAAEGGAQDSDNDTPGIQLNVTVPSGATVSNIFARFRYSTDNNLEPTGTANDGEVEDYQIAIAAASDPNLLLVKRITAINPGSSDEVQFNTFVNDDSNNDGDFDNDPDNDPNWPTDDNIYLRGATTVADVQPGDEVEYTIYFLSNGDEDATNVKICDVIPDNMSFVSNSYDGNSGIALLNSSASSATPTNLSNAEDTDEGRFYAPGAALPTAGDPPTNLCQKVDSTGNIISVGAAENINGAIVVEIESLPEVTAPGTPDNSYGFIRFRAKIK